MSMPAARNVDATRLLVSLVRLTEMWGLREAAACMCLDPCQL